MDKIAIITNSHKGKDVRLYYKLADSLKDKFTITIFTPFPEISTKSNITITKIEKSGKIEILKQIYRKVTNLKPQYVICVEPLTMLVGILLKKKFPSIRIYYDCHEFFAQAFSETKPRLFRKLAYYFYYFLENRLISRMDKVFTVNEVLAERLAKVNDQVKIYENYPLNKIKNLENKVKTKEFDCIYIGGISKEKGMEKILRAAAKVKDIKILFVGKFLDEKSKSKFNSLLNSLYLNEKITYAGIVPHSQIPTLLDKAKFGLSFLSPKTNRYRYAVPLKLLEYLQKGLPVITNNFKILDPFVKELNTGFQIEFNTLSLINTFRKIKKMDELTFNLMSDNGKKSISEKYNWENKKADFADEFRHSKNLLLLAYFFPPLGGPGVQRPCKMIKYLKKRAWETDVISVKDIVFHSYDYSLEDECNARKIFRTESLDPMSILKKISKLKNSSDKDKKSKTKHQNKLYFKTPEKIKSFIRNIFPIDDKIGWLPFAYFKALKLIKKNKYSHIMATIGPYTSAVAAYLAAKKTNLPLIIDYRDHWTLNPYLKPATKFHLRFSERMEKRILDKAELITTVSKTMKNDLIDKFGNSLEKKIEIMYNAWDEADFKEIKANKDKEKLIFNYVGNFYGHRTVKYFCDALKNLNKDNDLPQNLEINFIGNYYGETLDFLSERELKMFIKIHPQVEHRKALEFMLNSDVLLLFIASPNGKGVLTGKIFEYFRTGNEILAMVPPDGEAAEMLREKNYKFISAMEDVDMIERNLRKIINDFKKGGHSSKKIDWSLSREVQSYKIDNFLRS